MFLAGSPTLETTLAEAAQQGRRLGRPFGEGVVVSASTIDG
jgi:hypothetical protein